MQKYPDVLVALSDTLRADGSDNAQELVATTAGADADSFTKTTSAVTGMMKALKSTGVGASAAQALSDYNFDKFAKAGLTAAAYLKAHAAEFTPAQAASMADRIINVMNYTSKESLRTMPKEMAEWLKYATGISEEDKKRIVKKHPVFIAGYERAPMELVQHVCDNMSADDVEVVRAYAKLSPEDERTLDRRWFDTNKPVGIDYNNVDDLVSNYRGRYGTRSLGRDKLVNMRNVPAPLAMEYLRANNSLARIREFRYPTDALAQAVFDANPRLATAKTSGIRFPRKSPKMRAMTKHIRQHGSLRGFNYTPPAPVQLPRVAGQRPVARAAAPAERQAAPQRAPVERAAVQPDGRFPNKAAHARHIYDNRGPDDTRQSIIRQFVEVVGLTAAGASTYYYNLSRGPVREGDEDMGLLRSTLLSILMD
jgi:hypothetical protein